MSDKILSISEAAEYIGVLPLTLRNWERDGKIKPFRTLGGHRRFRKRELDILLGTKEEKEYKLDDSIRNLEAIRFNDNRQERLNGLIKDLKEMVECAQGRKKK